MRYLIITTHLGHGGAEKLIIQFANRIESSKTTILFLYNTKESKHNIDLLKETVNLKFLFKRSTDFNGIGFKLQKILSFVFVLPISLWLYFHQIRNKYDVIHINLITSSFYSIFFNIYRRLTFSKEVYVETFHTNLHLLKWYLKPIFQLNWLFVDKIIYEIGEGDFDNYRLRKKVKYIPFTDNFEQKKEISKPGFNNKLRLGMLARARRFEKKLDFVLEILEKLKNIDRLESFHFGGDGEDLNWFKKEVSKRKLSNKVIFHGFIEDTSKFHSLYDIALAVTVDGTPGLSGIETISNGKALVGIASRSNPDLQNNPLVESSDSNTIIEHLIMISEAKVYYNYTKDLINYFNKSKESVDFIGQYNELFKKLLCP